MIERAARGAQTTTTRHSLTSPLLVLLLILSSVCLAALPVGGPRGARAAGPADGTAVALDPPTLEMAPGDLVTVAMQVYTAANLQAFYLSLTFDPDVVRVVDADPAEAGINVALGDFLTAESVPVNTSDNLHGTIAVGVSQTRQPPRSGSGLLFSLTLEAIAEGDARLQFDDVALSTPQGLLIPCASPAPSYLVLNPTATPSQTVAPTPTPVVTLPAATAAATVAPTEEPVCADVLQDGGFEQPSTLAWVLTQGAAITDTVAHTGTYSAALGGASHARGELAQRAWLPQEAARVVLTWWWRMHTEEVSHPRDYLYVELLGDGGQLLALLEARSDAEAPGAWQRSSAEITPYTGQPVTIRFRVNTDGAYATTFYIDDARLDICVYAGSAPRARLPLALNQYRWP